MAIHDLDCPWRPGDLAQRKGRIERQGNLNKKVHVFRYRKAGYSKKFLAEHESEIILHKAAKQFFDEKNLKKLPTVKSLQAEYAQLLSEKKAMYANYQRAREQMRSLQTAKANVDRILGETVPAEEKEQEKDGR